MKQQRKPTRIAWLLLIWLIALSVEAPTQTQQPREFAPASRPAVGQWPATPVRRAKAMVVSDDMLASEAGVEVMKQGGNAVDAAVAVAFVLAVVSPQAGNIGGGGFMLVRLAGGRTAFVDYRETAPLEATRNMYMKPDGSVDPEASAIGYRSVGVPGTVAGLALALKEYGRMKLKDVMEKAIHLAEDGFPVGEKLATTLRGSAPMLERFPRSRRIFLKGGAYYQAGDVFRQPELAATLRRIAKKGPGEFYRGRTAHDLASEMRHEGGLVTLSDLARYKPKIRKPLTKIYPVGGQDWEVITSPPPSSGGIATIEALNILETLRLKSWDDPESVAWVIEAMRRAFADRALYLADPDFAKIPVALLTSDCYADSLRATIDVRHASSSEKTAQNNIDALKFRSGQPCVEDKAHPPYPELKAATGGAVAEATRGGHTTHFSVVDSFGNAVSNTYTLNDYFGSGVTSADGFILNDEMDDFTTHPGSPNMFGLVQSEANGIGPGKRPLSSMMPTILLRDGQLSFVTGSPGGPRIISATLLSILDWMRFGMDAQAAVNAPRFHQQWLPDVVLLEPSFPDAVTKDLEARGYRMAPERAWIGEVEAIGIDPSSGERLGAPDPRRQGAAAGY
jgi:gamma-glutamyltranspeptidase / glutathione hydrolase